MWFLDSFTLVVHHVFNHYRPTFIESPICFNLVSRTSVRLVGLLAAPPTNILGPVALYSARLRLAFAHFAVPMFLTFESLSRTCAAFAGALIDSFEPYVVTESWSY